MKQIFILLICLLFLPAAEAGAQYWHSPKREYRAVWVTTIENLDWPKTKIKSPADIEKQKSEFVRLLDSLAVYNINTVLLQTRVRGDLIYPSAIEPFSAVLTGKAGKDPGYDPLAFAIEECHKRDMQLHAWLVTLPLGKVQHVNSLGRNSVTRKRPDLCKLYKGSWYMEPGVPETADYLTSLVAELVGRYDVDGVHLDYIRYPDRPRDYNDHALHRKYGRGMGHTEWRRANVTGIVRSVYRRVKELKPWVRVSCAPLGKHDNLARYSSRGWDAYNTVYQEAQRWLEEGIMDALFPMMYFSGNNFYPFVLDWQENASGRHIAPGLGVYRLMPSEGDWEREEITRQFFTSRDAGAAGTAIFRAEHLLKNYKGVAEFLKVFNRKKALIPAMDWSGEPRPETPGNFKGVHSSNTLCLAWNSVNAKPGRPATRYNVYRSSAYPVDTENVDNLVASNLKDTVLVWYDVPQDSHWAVTAVDAFDVESRPAEWHERAPRPKMYRDSFLLPEAHSWGMRVLIKDFSGKLLYSMPYNESVNVEGLPAGCYRMEVMSRKGEILQRELFVR